MNVFSKPEIADSYDDYYQTEGGKRVNQIETGLIDSALQKIPQGKMLELGCGTGHWTEYFITKGFDVVATDSSDAMLKYAVQRGFSAEILKADSENLPFAEHSFDVVSSVTMVEFVNNQEKVFSEIGRVLKPNGWLLLGCLNANSQLAKNAENDPVFKNARFFTPEKLTGALMNIGTPEITSGVHFSGGFDVMDDTIEKENHEPAFLVVLVQKTR